MPRAGPNGVGKSAIADAIRFCLGSSRDDVRAEAMCDVISRAARADAGDAAARAVAQVGFAIERGGDDAAGLYVTVRRVVSAQPARSRYLLAESIEPVSSEAWAAMEMQPTTLVRAPF